MIDTGKGHKLWSDAELKAATDAYLYMLQLEQHRIPFSISEQSDMLISGPLHQRNDASIRYRMRNISFAVAERGLPVLEAFSPAPQVGRNVLRRLNRLLDSRSGTLKSIRELRSRPNNEITLGDVLQDLNKLKDRIAELEAASTAGIGHNNPPDSIDLSAEEISAVVNAIAGIGDEVAADEPDKENIRSLSQKISSFGMKVWVWTGQRLTDFARAGAVAAGTGFGLSLSDLGEQIVNTLKSVFEFIF